MSHKKHCYNSGWLDSSQPSWQPFPTTSDPNTAAQQPNTVRQQHGMLRLPAGNAAAFEPNVET
jgi:hypothetical protein